RRLGHEADARVRAVAVDVGPLDPALVAVLALEHRFFGGVDYRPGRHPTGRHRAVGRPAAVVVAVPLAREAALEPALPHQRAVERGQPVAVAVARARIAVAVARARIAVARIA